MNMMALAARSPAPFQGAHVRVLISGGCAMLHHRLISTAPPALMHSCKTFILFQRAAWRNFNQLFVKIVDLDRLDCFGQIKAEYP